MQKKRGVFQRVALGQKVALGVVAAMFVLSAQPPTCNRCSATYVGKGELDAYTKRAIENNLVDQQVRSVDLGKTQLGLGIVYRGKLDRQAKNSVAEHDLISEVYYVIEGSATLETGPDIVGEQRRPATLKTVKEYNGPGNNGASIRNGVTYHLVAGDAIIVPAGTGHMFTKIDDHIRYLMVRIDPDRAVPLKNEAQSKAYLASPSLQGPDN